MPPPGYPVGVYGPAPRLGEMHCQSTCAVDYFVVFEAVMGYYCRCYIVGLPPSPFPLPQAEWEGLVPRSLLIADD